MKQIVLDFVSFAILSGPALAQSSRDSDRRSDRYSDVPQFIDPPLTQGTTRPGDPSLYATVPGAANPYATTPGAPNYWGTTPGAPNVTDPKVGAPNPADARIGAPNPWATVPGAPPSALGSAPGAQNPSSTPRRRSDEQMTPVGRASRDRAPDYPVRR